MRISILAFSILFSSSILGSATDATLSTEPLTKDQREIYRDFLASQENSKSVSHVINQTSLFETGSDCLKGFGTILTGNRVHRIPAELAQSQIVKLVDPGTPIQRRQIDSRGRNITDPGSVGSLVDLSEIAFNQQHDRAALAMGIFCGPHCGAGRIVFYELRDGKWMRGKSCPTWIS
jgi:hypothetical protein